MSNAQEVTVLVTILETGRYSTYVKMPRKQFEELENELENERGYDLQLVEERIGEFCDRESDWQSADGLEVEEFRIVEDVK